MIPLGLTKTELRELNALLITHHRIEISAQLLTLDHRYVGNISNRLLGGQVTIDASATESTRSASLEILDIDHALHLDYDGPEDGSMYATRMVKIVYTVVSINGTRRFDIPVFTGPIDDAQRNGPILSVTCLGKEKLLMAPVWKARSFKKNTSKTYIIRWILSQYGGEMKFDIPDIKGNPKIGQKMAFNRDDNPWAMATRLATSMGQQLYYDGRGTCRMRPRSPYKTYRFTAPGALLSQPQVGYKINEAINCVEVIYKVKGKGKKAKTKSFKYRLVAPRTHPLSPYTLGRTVRYRDDDGELKEKRIPRYLPLTIEDDSIKSLKAAKAVAKRELTAALVQQAEVTFDSLPIPYLEEGDLCTAVSNDFSGTFRINQMTIPLTADGVSTMGYIKRVTPKKRAIKARSRLKKRAL